MECKVEELWEEDDGIMNFEEEGDCLRGGGTSRGKEDGVVVVMDDEFAEGKINSSKTTSRATYILLVAKSIHR